MRCYCFGLVIIIIIIKNILIIIIIHHHPLSQEGRLADHGLRQAEGRVLVPMAHTCLNYCTIGDDAGDNDYDDAGDEDGDDACGDIC